MSTVGNYPAPGGGEFRLIASDAVTLPTTWLGSDPDRLLGVEFALRG